MKTNKALMRLGKCAGKKYFLNDIGDDPGGGIGGVSV